MPKVFCFEKGTWDTRTPGAEVGLRNLDILCNILYNKTFNGRCMMQHPIIYMHVECIYNPCDKWQRDQSAQPARRHGQGIRLVF